MFLINLIYFVYICDLIFYFSIIFVNKYLLLIIAKIINNE
jgi:hypothetical protein